MPCLLTQARKDGVGSFPQAARKDEFSASASEIASGANITDNVQTSHLPPRKLEVREKLNNLSKVKSNIENARGFTYQRFDFDGQLKENVIVLIKNKADTSTIIHEFAHVYLTTLNNMARKSERAKSVLLNVNKWLRYNGVEYTDAQHEKFAVGFAG